MLQNPMEKMIPEIEKLSRNSIFFNEGELNEDNFERKINEKIEALRAFAFSKVESN